jgi:zinc D-Ala-D-Ala dipeptidase
VDNDSFLVFSSAVNPFLMRWLIGLFCLLFNVTLLFAQSPRNPYNLDLMVSAEAYYHAVTNDKNNEMIDLQRVIPGLVLDIRYATTNNFTGQQLYDSPRAFLRRPVAEALFRVQQELNKQGIALKIMDAYRPYSVTLKFYELYRNSSFVAVPWIGSRHNRGVAVDLSLIDLKTGSELLMPTPFDEFTERAHPDYAGLPEEAIRNRDLLINIMSENGFIVFQTEWWHFDFRGWEQFGLMDLSFQDLDDGALAQ